MNRRENRDSVGVGYCYIAARSAKPYHTKSEKVKRENAVVVMGITTESSK